MNPADKRLAVLVEDHPLDYAAFEGIIPEGRYGAGTVVIWDAGSFTPLEDLKTGLSKGRLSFSLMGKRLRGEFALVRLKSSKTDKEWLLIKKQDAFADPSWKLEKALTANR
jgi:bifunctional non-homologous end joining protein LigD